MTELLKSIAISFLGVAAIVALIGLLWIVVEIVAVFIGSAAAVPVTMFSLIFICLVGLIHSMRMDIRK